MTRSKYSLEIEFDGGSEDSPRFMSLSCITTEGDSLSELIDNAVIGRVDQDGGDHGHIEIECMSKALHAAAVEEVSRQFAESYL